jgi:hypothetical protein
MKVITLKLKNNKEWHFLLNLLKRLQVPFEWKEEANQTVKNKVPQDKDIIAELFGSWQSDKSSDEIIQSINDARVNQTREINL